MPSTAWFLLCLFTAASWCNVCLSQSCPCPCPHHEPQQTHCRCVDQSVPSDSPGCLNGSIPCRTLNYALLTNLTSDTCILVLGGNQTYNASLPVRNVSNLLITGAGQDETTVSCDSNSASGLAFIGVTELTIANLSFVNCEAERNSTTYYEDSNMTEPFLVGLYCWLCANVTLDHVQVSDSSGIGVVFYETGGNNNISHSVFSRNRFPKFNESDGKFRGGGGGVTVEYPFCHPGTAKYDCINGSVSNYNKNSKFTFNKCRFEDNYSFLKNHSEYTFITPGNQSHIAFGRGGGLTLYFRGKAQGNHVTIFSCTFFNNTALFGGGVLSEFQDTSTGNDVSVLESYFLYNECPYNVSVGTSGGGIRIGFTFLVENSALQVANSFFMEGTKFIGNKAYVGGGLSFITGKQPSDNRSFYLSNCDWINNTARLGAAMDVTKWGNVPDGSLPNVEVLNCTFKGNSVWYMEDSKQEIVGCGVVYADTVPIHFAGLANFIDNTGSGIAIRSTYVTFTPLEVGGRSALFQRNEARDGGGIAIYGDAWIEVHPNYTLNFIKNHAFYRGGAIFYEDVGNRNLLSSRRCFIQYSDPDVPHEDWNASFKFVNNTARQNGHSIFCTSLIPCVWGGVEGSGSVSPSSVWKTFNWSEAIFSYECTTVNCSNEIASGPSAVIFTTQDANSSRDEYFVFSGERSEIPFIAVDDLGLAVDASFYVSAAGDDFSVKSNVASKHYTVTGCPNSTRNNTLTFYSIEDLPLRVKIDVSISECPPGFIKQDSPKCLCACLPDRDYIATCNSSNMTAMIRQGRWVGCFSVNESTPLHSYSDYVYGHCPYQYCNDPYNVVPLVNDTNQTCGNFSSYFCNYSGQRRAGVLCSRCQKGYGISLTSWDYQCVECPPGADKSAIAFFILLSAEILPLLIFIVLIMMFDINILAAPVYSFVFFCQVKYILLPLEPYDIDSEPYTALTTVDRFLSGLLNLRFLGLFISNMTCISQDLNVLDILLIRYAILFFPVLIIGITLLVVKAFFSGYCCGPLRTAVGAFVNCMNKLKEDWTPGTSILHGLCGFLVLAYADLVRISTIMLSPAYLYDASGQMKDVRVRVQGDVQFFDSEHLPYALVAIFVLAVSVVLPCFLLLTHPLLPQFLVYCKLAERRPFKWIHLFYTSNRLKPIFDCFQGCFHKKMGFFAGLFLFYRIAFLLVSVIAEKKPTHLLLAKLLLILIIFFLHSFFHPYGAREQKKFVNKVDSCMFLFMGALVAMVYFNYAESTYYSTPVKAWLWIQLVIQYLPFVYFLLLASWYTRHSIKRRLRRYRCCLACCRMPLLLDQEMEESLEESYGAFDQERRGAVQEEWLDDD